MKIRELFPDVITEDLNYEYKALLNPENPVNGQKPLLGFANNKGGTIYIGVSNAEHFMLAVNVSPAESVIRYREGDYNETVYIKSDGNVNGS